MASVITDHATLKAIVAAGAAIGMQAHQIKAENVYEHQGPKADELRMSLEALSPQIAAGLKGDAVGLSAGAVLARAGELEMTPALRTELMSGDISYRAEQESAQAKAEADLLASWDKAANEKQAARGMDPTKPSGPQNWQTRWAADQEAMKAAGL